MNRFITRRSLLRGLFAAPAIIAAERLMPVRAIAEWSQTAAGVWVPVGHKRFHFIFTYDETKPRQPIDWKEIGEAA